MAHEKVSVEPLPSSDLLFEGTTYNLNWFGDKIIPDPVALPSPDFANYLIGTVNFRCCQLFHLYDEESFMQSARDLHNDPRTDRVDLWFIHYLLVLAIGQALTAQTDHNRRPPGAALFVWAMKLLPDPAFLQYIDSIESLEVLCCASLYLHCLNFRRAAWDYVSGFVGPVMMLMLIDYADWPGHAYRYRSRPPH